MEDLDADHDDESDAGDVEHDESEAEDNVNEANMDDDQHTELAGVGSEPELEAEGDNAAGVAGENEMDQRYGSRKHEYNLRPRKQSSYKHRHADLEDIMMPVF
jgi:hypothetical protein